MLGLFQKMLSIKIESGLEDYSIQIQSGIFNDLMLKNEFVLLDSVFRERFSGSEAKVIWVDAKEDEKNLHTCEQVLIQMKNLGMTRQSHLVAVGGGFVQDVATLSASLFMRGIKWSYVPTTLMSMLDSCVGGKSSINVNGAKNLVGNIYPPNSI